MDSRRVLKSSFCGWRDESKEIWEICSQDTAVSDMSSLLKYLVQRM